jgi:hypothetical protein
MDQILVDAVFKAMLIREKAPLNEDFDEETLAFLQDLFLWRRPDKFIVNGENHVFVAGCVSLWAGRDRVLQFEFDNGYIWEASITKLGSKALIQHCRWLLETYLQQEEDDYMDEGVAA